MLALLILKDLKIELRTRTSLMFIVTLSLLLSVVIAVGIQSAFLRQSEIDKIFPAIIWIVFFLTSTIVIGKSFDSELENQAIEGVLLSGVRPEIIYLSKLVLNFLISFVGHFFSLITLSVLLNVAIADIFIPLLFVSCWLILLFTALGCVTIFIASSSSNRSVLMPLILLPLLFPGYFAGLELSYELFINRYLDYSSVWLSLLVGMNVIYIVAGMNFFNVLLKK